MALRREGERGALEPTPALAEEVAMEETPEPVLAGSCALWDAVYFL